jgi:hypothetical protein
MTTVALNPALTSAANLLNLLSIDNTALVQKQYALTDLSYGAPAVNATGDGSGNDTQVAVSPGNLNVAGSTKIVTYNRQRLSAYTPLTLTYTLVAGTDYTTDNPDTLVDANVLDSLLHVIFTAVPAGTPVAFAADNLVFSYATGQNMRPGSGGATVVTLTTAADGLLLEGSDTVTVTLTWPAVLDLNITQTGLSGFS